MRKLFCQLSKCDPEAYPVPDWRIICPPSPAPPAGGGPSIILPSDEAVTAPTEIWDEADNEFKTASDPDTMTFFQFGIVIL